MICEAILKTKRLSTLYIAIMIKLKFVNSKEFVNRTWSSL